MKTEFKLGHIYGCKDNHKNRELDMINEFYIVIQEGNDDKNLKMQAINSRKYQIPKNIQQQPKRVRQI